MSDDSVSMTEIEEAAKAQGWSPEKGDKSALEFLKDGRVYRDRNLKEISSLREQVSAMANENRAVMDALGRRLVDGEKRDYKQQKAALDSGLQEAIDSGDVDRAREVATQIQELREPEDLPQSNPNEKLVQNWVQENSWMNENVKMRDDALAFYHVELQKRGGVDDAASILPEVEARIREYYPDHFDTGNPNTGKGAGVEEISQRGENRAPGVLTRADLTEDESENWDQLIKSGIPEEKLLESVQRGRQARGGR